jgi:carbon monoxide dehydrogenase subunit G
MKVVAEANINETVERVWDIFFDFATYQQWNPFIKSITGKLAVDSTIHVKLANSDEFKAKITKLLPEKEFEFKRKGIIPLIYTETHTFLVIDSPGSRTVTFRYEIEYGGARAQKHAGDTEQTRKLMDSMVRALRARIYNCVTCF